jgi:AcrR family transcriptional regulator
MTDDARLRKRPALIDVEKLHRRGEIMVAAKTGFVRNGFHATTIGDIAREAGLGYGAQTDVAVSTSWSIGA